MPGSSPSSTGRSTRRTRSSVSACDPPSSGGNPHNFPEPASARGGHGELRAFACARRPALHDRFLARIEADSFLAIGVRVAEEAVLPAAEAMPGHRDGDGDVDADHAHLDAPLELTSHPAVARITGDAVGKLVSVDKANRLAEILDPYTAQHGSEDLLLVYGHVGCDMIEERAAEEKATLVSGYLQRAAVGHQLRPFAHAGVDVARDALERLAGHDWAHFHARVHAIADTQRLGSLREPGSDPVRDITHQDGDTDRHATLAGRSVGRTDQSVHRLVQVGVRHDDQVILCAAECLHALAQLRAARVEASGDRGRADEAQGPDLRVLEQRIDGDSVALHDVENAVRQPGLLEEL